MLLRTFDNAGDRVSSAFPKGKQNEALKGKLQLTYRRDIVLQTKLKMLLVVNMLKVLFILFTLIEGDSFSHRAWVAEGDDHH